VSESAYSDENYPAGEYALVFLGKPEVPTPVTLQVRQGRIVRIVTALLIRRRSARRM